MEELRSTEILDKEIQEDARRKAERILQNADAECDAMIAAVDTRIKQARDAKQAAYDEKLSNLRHDSEASMPLEKQRFLISYENSAVHDACIAYLDALKDEQKLELIEKLLVQRKTVLGERKFNARVCGFDISAVKALLKKVLGAASVVSCKEADKADGVFEGCLLESEDRTVICRLTIAELIEDIEDTKRYELVSALFAGRLGE